MRSSHSAASLPDGVTAAVGPLTDVEFLREQLAGIDGVVHTGGTWIHGSGDAITEATPVDPPPDGRVATGGAAARPRRRRGRHPEIATAASRTRGLGWRPSAPGLLEELTAGSHSG